MVRNRLDSIKQALQVNGIVEDYNEEKIKEFILEISNHLTESIIKDDSEEIESDRKLLNKYIEAYLEKKK